MKGKRLVGGAVAAIVLVLVTGLTLAQAPEGTALGTAFTYQGYLKSGGLEVSDACDLQFALWDAETDGSQVGLLEDKADVHISSGLFTVQLDFGEDAFRGEGRWLEIAVRCPGDPGYTTLTPRQALTPAPYALALPGLWTQQNITSTNLIGGYGGNWLTSGVYGATIAGGGRAGDPNRITDRYGTVGGGVGNQAGDNEGNLWEAGFATVGGGRLNSARAGTSTIGGGTENVADGWGATIGGGATNSASGDGATVTGGNRNTASGGSAIVGGGQDNTASGDSATIGGGAENVADGWGATIGGGGTNSASGDGATVAGGHRNTVSGSSAAVGGGQDNNASYDVATVGGGHDNVASFKGATVGGGGWNTVSGGYSTIGGGWANSVEGFSATVGGGITNTITADGNSATIGGGERNTASGPQATVSGGGLNIASAEGATVAGGGGNTASGQQATVAGGGGNTASGRLSFAAGSRAKAYNAGAFVWADNVDHDFVSSGDNSFNARATGGFWFWTGLDGSGNPNVGAVLYPGSSAWSELSDRNLKANVAPVDTGQLLERLAEVPISTWSYKTQDPTIRHIGPMAQDFYAAFGVGEDERRISTVDADGVALAAIQGLYAENQALKAQLSMMEARLSALEQGTAGEQPARTGARLPMPWLLAGGLVVAGGALAGWRRRSGGGR